MSPRGQYLSARHQRANCSGSNAANFQALRAALFSRRDSNSGQRDFQTCRQKPPQRFIGAVIDRRSGKANLDPSLPRTRNFIAARPRLQSHRKAYDAVFFRDLHNLVVLLSLAKQRGPHADFSCAFLDGNFKVM